MNPTPLPFLILHGAWVWPSLLTAGVCAILGLGWGVRRLRERRALRRELLGFHQRAGRACATGGAELVRGTLHGEPNAAGELATRTDTLDEPVASWSWRAERLTLRADDGREILLPGDLRLIAGTRARFTRRWRPLHVSDADLLALEDPTTYRTTEMLALREGDEILAYGHLTPAPSSEETSYRDAAVQWTMHGASADAADDALDEPAGSPEGDEASAATAADADEPAHADAIELVARRPRAPRRRLTWPALGAAVLTLAGLGYAAERKAGDHWNRQCSELHYDRLLDRRPVPLEPKASAVPLALDNGHACARAAAMPGVRARALDSLSGILEKFPRQHDALEPLLAMRRLLRPCGSREGAVDYLLDRERYEDALREAEGCGDRRGRHLALVGLGRFGEAAVTYVNAERGSAPRPALPEVTTLIAAKRWGEAATALEHQADEAARAADAARAEAARAADAARAEAAAARTDHADASDTAHASAPPETATAEPSHEDFLAIHLRCLAALVRHHGGDPDAGAALRALRAAPLGDACAPMLAELDGAYPSAAERRANRFLRSERWMDVLAFAAGAPGLTVGLHEAAETWLMDRMFSREGDWLPWLTSGEIAAPAGEPDRVRYLRWRMARAILDGDLAQARSYAEGAVIHTWDLSQYGLMSVLSPLPLVAWFTPTTELGEPPAPPPEFDADLRAHWRARFARWWLRLGEPGPPLGADDVTIHALAQAAKGDGLPLARLLDRPDPALRRISELDFLAVLPRITSGRAELAGPLSTWTGYRESTPTLAARARYAFERREVMRFAGLSDEQDRWQGIYARLREVLSDRQRLVPLMLLDL
ncbi:MAG: hypothetical protein R3B48_19690 [Kofleriaceae bacterium]